MKRFITALLILVFCISLVACNSGDKEQNGNSNAPLKVGFIYLHDENSTYDLNFLNAAKQLAAREYDAKLMESIGEVLTDEFQLRTVFAEALDITPSKASTLLNKMAAAGLVEKGEVKGEKGKQVGYKRA